MTATRSSTSAWWWAWGLTLRGAWTLRREAPGGDGCYWRAGSRGGGPWSRRHERHGRLSRLWRGGDRARTPAACTAAPRRSPCCSSRRHRAELPDHWPAGADPPVRTAPAGLSDLRRREPTELRE